MIINGKIFKAFFFVIWQKTRKSIYKELIKHCTGYLSQCNKAKYKNKRYKDWKERNECYNFQSIWKSKIIYLLFLYLGYHYNYYNQWCISNVMKYMTHIQKITVFLYIRSNNQKNKYIQYYSYIPLKWNPKI